MLDYGIPPYRTWENEPFPYAFAPPHFIEWVLLSVVVMGDLDVAQRCVELGANIDDAELCQLNTGNANRYVESLKSRTHNLYHFLLQNRAVHL
jgi:hypothetical protein